MHLFTRVFVVCLILMPMCTQASSLDHTGSHSTVVNVILMNSNQSSSQALEITMNGCLNTTDYYLGKGLGISHPLKRIDFFIYAWKTSLVNSENLFRNSFVHSKLSGKTDNYFVSSYNLSRN